MVRFFRKSIPDTPVILSGGRACRFSTLDHVTGFFATESDQIQAEFVGFIEQMRYGLSEITYEDYKTGYLDKKKASPPVTSRRRWREEIGPSQIVMYTSSSRVTRGPMPASSPPAAGEAEASDIPRRNGVQVKEMTGAEAAKLPDAKKEEPNQEFNPPTGKRPKTPDA